MVRWAWPMPRRMCRGGAGQRGNQALLLRGDAFGESILGESNESDGSPPPWLGEVSQGAVIRALGLMKVFESDLDENLLDYPGC